VRPVRPVVTTLILVLLSTVVFSGAFSPVESQTPTHTWTGNWDCRQEGGSNFQMTLTQSGANVVGKVSVYYGVVEGVAQGNKLEGIFRTDKNLAPIDVEFSFTMSEDWMSWEGYTWNVGDKEKDPRIYWAWMQGVRGVDLPFVVNLETDKTTYEQGEAITVNVQVLYNNVPFCPTNSMVNFTAESPDGRTQELPVKTDNSGKCSFMPFAGHLTGNYKLYVKCSNTTVTGTEEKKITAVNQTAISVIEESFVGVDKVTQLNKIIELYKAQIPEGPIRGPGFAAYRVKYPESMYGSVHNMFIAKKWADPGSNFVCGGYQTKVLAFFDSIRFNADPGIRKLLKGFDYGPISRAGGPEWLIGHHAVVLFVTGNDWWWANDITNTWVFDPWPRQKPVVTSVVEFAGPLGRATPDCYATEQTKRDWFYTGYPLTGGVVYTNPSFMKSDAKSPLPPKSSILVDCPVDVLVTDATGKRAGALSNGTEIQEFSAYFYRTVESNETLGWYFGVFEGVYDILITGKATGTFELLISGDAAGGKILDYGSQPITEGEQTKITIGTSDNQPLLSLPDGKTVRPQTIEFTPLTTSPTPTPASTPTIVVVVIVVVVVVFVVVLFGVSIARKGSKSSFPEGSSQYPPPPPPPP
jgi:hypothetical protein